MKGDPLRVLGIHMNNKNVEYTKSVEVTPRDFGWQIYPDYKLDNEELCRILFHYGEISKSERRKLRKKYEEWFIDPSEITEGFFDYWGVFGHKERSRICSAYEDNAYRYGHKLKGYGKASRDFVSRANLVFEIRNEGAKTAMKGLVLFVEEGLDPYVAKISSRNWDCYYQDVESLGIIKTNDFNSYLGGVPSIKICATEQVDLDLIANKVRDYVSGEWKNVKLPRVL